jgi:hypothetical protein
MMKKSVYCSDDMDKKSEDLYELIFCDYCKGLYPILEFIVEDMELAFCITLHKIFIIKESDLCTVGLSMEYIEDKKTKAMELVNKGYLEFLVGKEDLQEEDSELIL